MLAFVESSFQKEKYSTILEVIFKVFCLKIVGLHDTSQLDPRWLRSSLYKKRPGGNSNGVTTRSGEE